MSHPRRSAARDAREDRTPADELADFVDELIDEVHTREDVIRHRTVNRGNRTIRVPEVLAHRTREVGLLDQLAATRDAPDGRLTRVAVLDPKGKPLRVSVLDDRGRQLIRPRWKWDDPNERKSGRYVDTPITQPLTRLRRGGEPGPGSAVPGAAIPGGSPGWDADGALAPIRSGASGTSRPPVNEAAAWLVHDIQDGVQQLRAELRAAAGQPPGQLVSPARALRELVGLATAVDRPVALWAVHTVRSWVAQARVVLSYDAPIVALKDVVCGECGEDQLRVRADASTAVWCAARLAVQGPAAEGDPWPVVYACGTTYPRHTWLDLLAATDTPASTRRARARLCHSKDGYGGRP